MRRRRARPPMRSQRAWRMMRSGACGSGILSTRRESLVRWREPIRARYFSRTPIMHQLSPRILAPIALLVSVVLVGVLVLREMARSDEARAAVLATRDGLDALDEVRGQ